MIRKSHIFSLMLLYLSCNLYAQDQPLYNQTYFNPYLYNPSYVGLNNVTEVFLTYRKQWASIADAPQISAFNLQHATRGNIALGLSVQSEKNTGLTTNTAYATFGYKVPFAQNHYLKFGLSAGALHNFLDIDEFTNSNASLINDPAFINSLDNTYYFSSQFGLHYQYRNFRIGASFPKLFDNEANSDQEFNNPDFNELRQKIFDASYLFNLGPFFDLRSYLIYRDVDNQQNQLEATIITYYKEQLWVGGGYRLDYGAAGHIGFVIKEIFELAYSYEFGGISGNSLSDGSHEFNLNIRLGKKGIKKPQSKIKSESKAEIVESQPEPDIEDELVKKKEYSKLEEPITEENEIEEEKMIENDTPPLENRNEEYKQVVFEKANDNGDFMAKGNYVIVGAFLNKENAERYSKKLAAAGYGSEIGKTMNKDYNYVYLENYENINDAISYKDKLRSLKEFQFKDAWVLVLE